MRGKIKLALMALVMMACSKEGLPSEGDQNFDHSLGISHDEIVLGERLENPYKTENITKALNSLYPTKAGEVDVRTTDLYVRFLPASQQEYDALIARGLRLLDHPMDHAIEVDGDWYHDPEIPQGQITWQYTVVPVDFEFPDIRYEIIDECYLAENDPETKSDAGVDWEAVERQAYVLTGNGNMLAPQGRSSDPVRPKGRITIVDKHSNGGRAIGVSGVMVSCNSFIKTDDTYTDKNGYYEMSKKFTADLNYRIVFDNKEKFSIGLNLILVPASVSSLGKASPAGLSMTVNKDSGDVLFKRCVVNNAVYDYIKRCAGNDLNLTPPPAGLRIWILHNLKYSGALMMHQGALLDNNLFKTYLGEYVGLIRIFLPDLALGLKNDDDYRDIYATTCHEMAHGSHYAKVKDTYWNTYIKYKVKSITTGKSYGDGKSTGAGHCEVAEMWAYYMESLMYKNRYGGDFPSFGNGYWFKPDILRHLHKNGFTSNEIFSVMGSDVDSKDDFERALIDKYPSRNTKIVQAFDKY